MISVRLEHVPSLFSEGFETELPTPGEIRRRKQALLREGLGQRARRLFAAFRYAIAKPRRRGLAPGLKSLVCAYLFAESAREPQDALTSPDGLCGLADTPSAALLMEGYSRGLLPFGPVGPTSWWSPSQRWVTAPGRSIYHATPAPPAGVCASIDADFYEVLARCARANAAQGRLGFGAKLKRAYAELHEMGLAHSIELRTEDGELLAGAFGVSIGRIFITEACFGSDANAAAALALLDRRLALGGYALHEARLGASPDGEPRGFIRDLGFKPVTRDAFLEKLRANLCGERAGRWRLGMASETALNARPPQKRTTGFGATFDLSQLRKSAAI